MFVFESSLACVGAYLRVNLPVSLFDKIRTAICFQSDGVCSRKDPIDHNNNPALIMIIPPEQHIQHDYTQPTLPNPSSSNIYPTTDWTQIRALRFVSFRSILAASSNLLQTESDKIATKSSEALPETSSIVLRSKKEKQNLTLIKKEKAGYQSLTRYGFDSLGPSQQQGVLHSKSPVWGLTFPKHIMLGQRRVRGRSEVIWSGTGAPNAKAANRANEVKKRLVGFIMAE